MHIKIKAVEGQEIKAGKQDRAAQSILCYTKSSYHLLSVTIKNFILIG